MSMVADMLSTDKWAVSRAKTVSDYLDSDGAIDFNRFSLTFHASINLLDLLGTCTAIEDPAGMVVNAGLNEKAIRTAVSR